MSRLPTCLVTMLAVLVALCAPAAVRAADPPKVYVVLWFDTEDYILPADDDASLKLASFLTDQGVRATFKIVGEKARTLERRKRNDVIAALKKHEIGYHSNWHSTQPTPAMYLSSLTWDEGVAEFDRREGPGRDDVERIFGQAPTCYGQPGSSWGPQSFGAMRKWNMNVYLDAGSHVQLDNKPHYYCGVLTMYRLAYHLRADLNDPKKLDEANERFLAAKKKLQEEGGGLISIYYHPCEWVHKQFWDGVNFSKGANPPREKWKEPPQKTAEETKVSYEIFENYIRFIKRFDDVEFITASQAAKLYEDKSRRAYSREDLKTLAKNVGDEVTFQKFEGTTLAPSEVFLLLNQYVAAETGKGKADGATLNMTPLGPTGRIAVLNEPVTVDWSQFQRTTVDVAEYVAKHGRVPGVVWMGSAPVPPEAYLRSLAPVAADLLDGKKPPENVEIKPTKLGVAKYVADDGPGLWGWVIFPPGFRAPAMMELARQQSWTVKPAVLGKLPK